MKGVVMKNQLILWFLVIVLSACTQAPAAATTPIPATPTQTAMPTETLPTQTPSPTPLPIPSCTETKGTVVSDEYQGVYVDGKVKVYIYLPPCYGKDNKQYPVIYLLHGKPMNRKHWLSLGVDQAADIEIGETGKGFIMVMPDVPEPLFCGTDGGTGSYETEFTQGLLPYIEGKYRISPKGRVIAGISRGAVWALEIGIKRSDLFSTIIALSPALTQNYTIPQYNTYNLVENAKVLPKFLLIAGDTDDSKRDTKQLAAKLQSKNADYELFIVSGTHEAKTWIEAIPIMFNYLFHTISPKGEIFLAKNSLCSLPDSCTWYK